MSNKRFKRTFDNLKANFFFGVLSGIPFILFLVMYIAPKVEKDMLDSRKETIKSVIDGVTSGLNSLDKRVKSGEMTLPEAKKRAKLFLSDLRFLGDNYLWVQDTKSKILLHPIKPKLNGKDLSNFKDPKGNKLFSMASEVALKDKNGFIIYYWPKVGFDEPVEKLSYIKHFETWGWVLGSGVYIDDIRAAVVEEKTMLNMAIGVITILCLFFSFLSGIYQIKKVVIPIRNSIHSLLKSVAGLKKNSEEMKVVGQSISRGAQDQASQIHQTTTSMQQIKSTVEFSGQNAKKSCDISKLSKSDATHGRETIENMASEMSHIDENYRQIMKEIEKSSDEFQKIIQVITEIEDKTKVINDIVFQTKLLSFNASVEAARAGEHGKGFAVVAEEVGNLASMSGKASNEISGILANSIEHVKDIVNTTNTRVQTLVDQGKSNLDKGMSSVKDSQHSLGNILTNVTNTDNMINEVLRASDEQQIGITEINNAVIELDRITHDNLKNAESSSSISESVFDEVSSLESLVTDLNKLIKGKDAA